jgi:DNA-binding HxlR family transcriptional regulator
MPMMRLDTDVLTSAAESRAENTGRRSARPVQLTSKAIAASSVNRALGVIGDRWALHILRESFAGVRRFEDLQARLDAARSTLANRLRGLVQSGVLERVPYLDRPLRHEYRLSSQGAELYGTTLLCRGWEHVWTPPRVGDGHDLLHKMCGHAMNPQLICGDCGVRVTLDNTTYEFAATGSGKPPKPLFRRLSSVTDGHDRGASHMLVHLTDMIGDRWTLLGLSAGFFGLRRFDAIQTALRIGTNILTDRLNRLVQYGLFRRRLYSQHPPRCEYRLTQRGRDLFPVAVTLMQWGDRWLAPAGRGNLRLFHKECGRELHAVVTCDHCAAPIRPEDIVDLAVVPTVQ